MHLKERFAAEFRLKAPAPGDFLKTDAAALRAKNSEAAALYGRSPKPALRGEQREELSGKRSPIVYELLRLCAAGLAAQPQIAADAQVSPDSCTRTAALDLATGKLIKATGDVFFGSTQALRLVSAEANRRGEQVLTEAHDRITSGDASAGDPQVLEAAFCEAFRLFEEAGRRSERATARIARRIAPLKARAEDARARASDADAIDAFLLPKKA